MGEISAVDVIWMNRHIKQGLKELLCVMTAVALALCPNAVQRCYRAVQLPGINRRFLSST